MPIEVPLIVSILMLWLIVSLLLAPLEALGWWAGWFEGDEERLPQIIEDTDEQVKDDVRGFLVFLTGISGVSGEEFLPEEAELLERLDDALTHILVVKDIYPYSVTNRALTGQRVFAWFWRFAQRMKLSGRPLQRIIGFLINLRNVFQVMVSADRRYGPIYNAGSAHLIAHALLRMGYQRHSGMPVTLLAYSGGGQIAVGAVPYLKRMIGAPVTVIALGGAMGGEPGVVEVEHLYYLYGKKDNVQRLGVILSPSRWRIGELPLLPRSRWNKTRKSEKMTFVHMGEMSHSGRGGYLDSSKVISPDGRSNMQLTVDTITSIVQGEGVPPIPTSY